MHKKVLGSKEQWCIDVTLSKQVPCSHGLKASIPHNCFDGTSSSEENSNMRQKLHLTGLKCTDISVVNENVVNYSVVIKSVVNEGVVNYSVVNGIQFQ